MKKIDISALKELNKELYDALKTYCPCNIAKGTDKKSLPVLSVRTGNALKKAKAEGVLE